MASSTLISKAFILSAAPPQQRQQPQSPMFNGFLSAPKFNGRSLTLCKSAKKEDEGGVVGSVLKNVTDTYADVKDAVGEKSEEAAEKMKENQDSNAKKLEEAGDAAAAKAKETKDFVAGKVDEAADKAAEFKESSVEKAKEDKAYVDAKTSEGKDDVGSKINELTQSAEDAAQNVKDTLFGKKD